jgi:very-short-patch-repair endonuclease
MARSLRHDATDSEALLWEALRRKSLDGRKFRRQHPIGHYIADFFCAEERLIVEVDGPIHKQRRGDDRERDRFFKAKRFKVLRVPSNEVERDLTAVLERIRKEFNPLPALALTPLSRRGRGAGGEGSHISTEDRQVT